MSNWTSRLSGTRTFSNASTTVPTSESAGSVQTRARPAPASGGRVAVGIRVVRVRRALEQRKGDDREDGDDEGEDDDDPERAHVRLLLSWRLKQRRARVVGGDPDRASVVSRSRGAVSFV